MSHLNGVAEMEIDDLAHFHLATTDKDRVLRLFHHELKGCSSIRIDNVDNGTVTAYIFVVNSHGSRFTVIFAPYRVYSIVKANTILNQELPPDQHAS